MSRLVRCVSFAGVAALALTFALDVRAQGDKQVLMKEHLLAAAKALEAENFEEAAKEFEEVLKLDPASSEALELRELVDVRFFIKATTKGSPAMRESALRLLERAAQAEKERITDRDRIARMVSDLLGSFEVRTRAYIGLTSAGRYAVPQLLEKLSDTKAENYADYRVRATVALIRIGEEAVLPLCTALRANAAHLRQDIVFILGQIGDPRAVPYLLRAAKADADEGVREVAAKALARIGEYTVIPDVPPHVALFQYARLYYADHPSVRRPSKYGHTVWNWSPEKQALAMQEVPGFLYEVSMARRVAAEALCLEPAYEPVLPLLISAYHKEIVLIDRRLELGKTDPNMALSELEGSQLVARRARAEKVLLTLLSSGERHFYRALSMQLAEDEPQLAAAIIEDLGVVAGPELAVYPDLPELNEPLRPVVVEAPPLVSVAPAGPAGSVELPPPTKEPSAAEPTEEKPEKPVRATLAAGRVRPDPLALFGVAVEAEKKATEPPPTGAKEPAAEPAAAPAPETLEQLLATARARAMERQLRLAAEAEEQRKKQVEAEAKTDAEAKEPPVNSLVRSLEKTDKAVRYAAARALARIKPLKDFRGAQAVVEILGQAITEKGLSTVLIVSKDGEIANRLRVLAREADHVPYSAGSSEVALATARTLPPKDVILLQDEMEETYQSLRKDPALAGIPVVVFTKEKDVAVAQQIYPGLPVVSLSDAGDSIKAAMTKAILGKRTAGEGRELAAEYASKAARALVSIPATGSPFSPHLPKIKDALVGALDSNNPEVRICAIRVLGKAKLTPLIPRLIDMCEAEDRAQEERLACIEAIGAMMEVGKPAPPEVVGLLQAIHRSGNDELRRFAVERLSAVSLPPASLEELINAQEAAEQKTP